MGSTKGQKNKKGGESLETVNCNGWLKEQGLFVLKQDLSFGFPTDKEIFEQAIYTFVFHKEKTQCSENNIELGLSSGLAFNK